MTTDKKSSITERLKALRDKVAGAITAAEEEESSVAEVVLPEGSAEASPVSEPEKETPFRRASDDAVASALMNFTWSDEQSAAEVQPEDIRVFFDGFESGPEAGPEPGEKPENLPEPETGSETPDTPAAWSAFQETATAENPVDAGEEESESQRWDRIIAEAEALLAQDASNEAAVSADEVSIPADEGGPSLEPADEAVTQAEPAEQGQPEYTVQDDPDISLPEIIDIEEQVSAPETERQGGFSWTELLGEIGGETPVEPEATGDGQSETEPGRISEELQPEESSSEPVGSGFAALLSHLRSNSREQKNETEKEEELPDISMFLQDLEENLNASDGNEPEPDPSDVAKLWEPHADRREKTEFQGDPFVDPNREETHVFTEEDLKNLPKDEDAGEKASSVADYRETEDEEETYTPRDFRPIRRRRYYRTGLVGGIMYFLFVLCVSVALACFAWLAADDMLSLNKEYMEAQVYVGEDMDVGQVATELKTKGLIRYRRLFALFGKLFHAEEKIEPGTYNLSTKLDYRALIQNMHHYTGWTGEELVTVKVTIPEGKTVMETFQILAEHGVCPYETLMECAAKETFNYDFLQDIPKGDASRLEGYLFPDTYEFYADSSPKAAICRFLDNFGERIGDRVNEQASAQGYTLREIITVASLIEKEAGDDLERATIASVIYNRLQSTSYPYLQIDATIQYAMGEHKEHLTYEDLQVDSPYNTYLYPGLPPGPISNPGLASIRAALSPESTGYYFYALNKNGKHEFFSSYNAFQRFINSSDFGG